MECIGACVDVAATVNGNRRRGNVKQLARCNTQRAAVVEDDGDGNVPRVSLGSKRAVQFPEYASCAVYSKSVSGVFNDHQVDMFRVERPRLSLLISCRSAPSCTLFNWRSVGREPSRKRKPPSCRQSQRERRNLLHRERLFVCVRQRCFKPKHAGIRPGNIRHLDFHGQGRVHQGCDDAGAIRRFFSTNRFDAQVLGSTGCPSITARNSGACQDFDFASVDPSHVR